MKIELTDKINEVIAAHKSNTKLCADSMRTVLKKWQTESNKYTPEYIRKAIQEELNTVLAESNKTDVVLNQKLKLIITESKEEILPFLNGEKEQSPDYSIKINNALQFLKFEGKDISDETAFKILKPFINDFEHMDLFANIVEKQVGTEKFINSFGECNFNKTFGTTNRMRTLLNLFNDVESIAENLFLFPKVDAEHLIFNNDRFIVKQDGYSEISSESNLINLCNTIADIVEKMASADIQEIQEIQGI